MESEIQVEDEVSPISFETIQRLKKEAVEESKAEIEALVHKLPVGLREEARKDIAGPMPRLKKTMNKIKEV